MKRFWLISDTKKIYQHLLANRRSLYLVLAVIGVAVLTLSAYKIKQVLSPVTTVTTSTGATISYQTSDNYLAGSTQTPLPNDIDDATSPTYSTIDPTSLGDVATGSSAVLPRLEGSISIADNCKNPPMDIILVIDRSWSMIDPDAKAGNPPQTKLYYAKKAAMEVVDQLAAKNTVGGSNPYYRIAVTTLPKTSGDINRLVELGGSTPTQIKQAISSINGAKFSSGTPFKLALNDAALEMNTLSRYAQGNQDVKRVTIVLSDGNPEPIDTMMPSADEIAAYRNSVDYSFSVLIRSDSDAAAIDLMKQIATPSEYYFEVSDASTLTAVYDKIVKILFCTSTEAEESISLPPSKLFTPSQFLLDDFVYDFVDKCGINSIGVGINDPCFKLNNVAKGEVMVGSSSSDGYSYYTIRLPKLIKEHVYHWRMTFKGIGGSDVVSFVSGLPANKYSFSNFTLAQNSACAPSTSASNVNYVCPISTISIKTKPTSSNLPTQKIKEYIRLQKAGVVSVEGNISAGYSANGFSVSTANAIVYGGAITKVVGGDQLQQYFQNNDSVLKWSSVSSQLQEVINGGMADGIVANQLPSTIWYLNSPTANPADSTSPTTFSSPPEGKLWVVNGNASFGSLEFNGRGTIIVNGNVTFNGPVTCTGSKRLGVIALGSITFNSNTVGCGGYLAYGGSITFSSNQTGAAKGMFVARDNINLPKMAEGAWLNINYDTTLANDPTVLFSEILDIIRLTTIS